MLKAPLPLVTNRQVLQGLVYPQHLEPLANLPVYLAEEVQRLRRVEDSLGELLVHLGQLNQPILVSVSVSCCLCFVSIYY